jgi:thiamine-phosphate pyrophosphorylase
MPSISSNLYLITDRHQTGDRPLTDVVHRSLEGGTRFVQLREKDLSSAELYRLAVDLRRLTREFDALLIINDRTDIALAVEADGVHIGISSLPVATVRKIIGQDKIIGYSAHGVDEALRVQAEGADFVTFGPVFPTPSKVAYGAPCGIKKLAEAVAVLKIPVFGLGGISKANITETLSANVQGVAVISAILAASDPFAATVTLFKKIEEHAQHS